MRKIFAYTKIICVIFAAVTALVVFAGCDGDKANQTDKTTINDNTFFSLDNLTYNNDLTEKAFSAGDSIDAEKIVVDQQKADITRSFSIVLKNGDVVIYKNSAYAYGSTLHIPLPLSSCDLVITLSGTTSDGNVIAGSREIRVSESLYPKKAVLTAFSGETAVTNPICGETYSFKASVVDVNGIDISNKVEDIYIDKAINGNSITLSFPDSAVDKIIRHNIYCTRENNLGEKKVLKLNAETTISDNLLRTNEYPSGIHFDYGFDLESTDTVSVNKNKQNFYDGLSAKYVFVNGNTKALTLGSGTAGNKVDLMIRYDGQGDFYAYNPDDYNYAVKNGKYIFNYYKNGANYQFNPEASYAEVYFLVYKETVKDGTTLFMPTKADGSDFKFDIDKAAPDYIKITSVTTRERDNSKPFSVTVKETVRTNYNDSIDISILCDIDNTNGITNTDRKKQRFDLNVEIGGREVDLSDYVITLDESNNESGIVGKAVIDVYSEFSATNGTGLRSYLALNTGTSKITVKSRFSDVKAVLTINVVNPVVDEAIDSDSNLPDISFGAVDFSDYARIKTYYLTSTGKNDYETRKLNANESLSYYIANAPGNNYIPGGKVSVTAYLQGNKFINNSYYVNSVYFIPPFTLKINSTVLNSSSFNPELIFVKLNNLIGDSDPMYFNGTAAKLEIALSGTFTRDSLIAESFNGGDVSDLRVQYRTDVINGQNVYEYTVNYRYAYKKNAEYYIPIAKLIIKG